MSHFVTQIKLMTYLSSAKETESKLTDQVTPLYLIKLTVAALMTLKSLLSESIHQDSRKRFHVDLRKTS